MDDDRVREFKIIIGALLKKIGGSVVITECELENALRPGERFVIQGDPASRSVCIWLELLAIVDGKTDVLARLTFPTNGSRK